MSVVNIKLNWCDYAHIQTHTLSTSNKYIKTHAKGHHSLFGLTRKQSLCMGRCNFLSHFLCTDSNYWSSTQQRKKLILFRYDNQWLIGRHIRAVFGCQGKRTDGKRRNWTNSELHTDGCTHEYTCMNTDHWHVHPSIVECPIWVCLCLALEQQMVQLISIN